MDRRLRTGKSSNYYVSKLRSVVWARFREAVYKAVKAEANAYRDCTPIMACLRAAESAECPVSVARMDWASRLRDTCRALNELCEAGRVRAKRRAYRPV